MKICHAHNLDRGRGGDKPFGIRVSLPPGDSFSALIDTTWERSHWYSSERERDRALDDMAAEHLYSRRGDRPTLRFEKVDPTGVEDGREAAGS